MESSDQAELERLLSAIASSRAATAAWRELLIELAGDHMCGSGPGPTQEDIDTLTSLEEAQQRAWDNYIAFLTSLSLKQSSRR